MPFVEGETVRKWIVLENNKGKDHGLFDNYKDAVEKSKDIRVEANIFTVENQEGTDNYVEENVDFNNIESVTPLGPMLGDKPYRAVICDESGRGLIKAFKTRNEMNNWINTNGLDASVRDI